MADRDAVQPTSSVRSNVRGLAQGIKVARLAARLGARHAEPTVMASLDDVTGVATPSLVNVALDAARGALAVDLSHVAERCRDPLDRALVQTWPGEHYRLLTALVLLLTPSLVIEVGTATGMSALALAATADTVVRTYDIVPWNSFPTTVLNESDFDERFEQRIGDLAQPAFFQAELAGLRDAGLIFVDGPKDGVFEPAFLGRLLPALGERPCLVVLDDIRLPNMVALWRSITHPTLDMTSFGHWSGTGLIQLGSWR